jgi:hypothetical protein
METTEDGRLDALRRRAGAPDEANVLVMLGFFRALCRDVDTLEKALRETAFWKLGADGSLCWCARDDMEPDDEHLPACAKARAVLGE